MYIITRKGEQPTMHQDLLTATQEAVKATDPPCWIWRLESSRLGTLKRIEVSWEDIQSTGIEGIWCIQNRSEKDNLEPVDGQLFFETQARGQVKISEYHRGELVGQEPNQLGRFVREANEKVRIASPQRAGQYLQEHIYTPFEEFEQEEMWVLLLNSRYRVTHQMMIYRGTVNRIQLRTGELFREAIRLNASALLIAHNHPSGDPEPSLDDREHACRVKRVAELLSIELLDVMILGRNSWVSLKQQMVI